MERSGESVPGRGKSKCKGSKMGKNDGLEKLNEGQFGQRAKTRGSMANDEAMMIMAPFLLPPPFFLVSYPPLHSGPAL